MNEMTNPFFIATSQRSGGFFLMSLLNSTKKVGYVHEYLYHLHEGWEGYFNGNFPKDSDISATFKHFREEALGDSPDTQSIWGSKVDIRESRIAQRWLELNQIEPKSIKWIWLRRRNKMRQALSFIKAGQTKIWHLDKTDSQEKQDLARAEIEVDFQDLCLKTIGFFTADMLWSNYFQSHGIKPHTLYYEDFVDESTWELTVRGLFDYLGVHYELPLNVATHRLKQSTGEVPSSYNQLIQDMLDYDLPLEYLDLGLDKCYELDLETF